VPSAWSIRSFRRYLISLRITVTARCSRRHCPVMKFTSPPRLPRLGAISWDRALRLRARSLLWRKLCRFAKTERSLDHTDTAILHASSSAALLTPTYVEEQNRIAPIPCLNPFAALLTVSALHHHIYEFRAQLGSYTGSGLAVPLYRPGSEERMRDGFEGRRQVSGEF
jgi:hypothetical protein